jgi:hypothetical protein
MLSLSGGERGHPTLLECGHWSYWLVKVEDGYRCSRCTREVPKEKPIKSKPTNA